MCNYFTKASNLVLSILLSMGDFAAHTFEGFLFLCIGLWWTFHVFRTHIKVCTFLRIYVVTVNQRKSRMTSSLTASPSPSPTKKIHKIIVIFVRRLLSAASVKLQVTIVFNIRAQWILVRSCTSLCIFNCCI